MAYTSLPHIRDNVIISKSPLEPVALAFHLLNSGEIQKLAKRNVKSLLIRQPDAQPIPKKPLRAAYFPGVVPAFFGGSASTVVARPLVMVSAILPLMLVRSSMLNTSYRSS